MKDSSSYSGQTDPHHTPGQLAARSSAQTFAVAVTGLFKDALDLIYPSGLKCICCGAIIDVTRTYSLCNQCMARVNWIIPGARTCDRCGKLLSANNSGTTCFSCRENPHVFHRALACSQYGALERDIIFSMKYRGHTEIGDILGEIMWDRLQSLDEMEKHEIFQGGIHVIAPVPLSRQRLLARGFNQSYLMAAGLARRMEAPCDQNLLRRIRNTSAMKSLTPAERRQNIRGAFQVTRDVTGQHVMVVDDIYTTGSTADEIATALMAAGAARVIFFTFAAGADVVKS
ncbi:double zinc ribbon domain-containing protein [Mobilibacterium timonense]|uniref:double zinc ribbon domain-containing protein n=1 Tax=Mobilibacterium timonense TaxID=1871012 RepID=UPI003A93869A